MHSVHPIRTPPLSVGGSDYSQWERDTLIGRARSTRSNGAHGKGSFFWTVVMGTVAAFFVFTSWSFARLFPVIEYYAPDAGGAVNEASLEPPKPEHILTPVPVRAIYMSSWVAGTKDWREELVEFIRTSEVNAIVIDVKDYSGKVSFDTGDSVIKELGAEELRVRDMREFIQYLHDNEIYVIARISSFQDPLYSKKYPDQAIRKKDGTTWKDHKGIAWVDPAARGAWEYTVRVARASEAVGFDELNFDYIRYPTDGDMESIAYNIPDGETRSDVIEAYARYLDETLSDLPIPLSADVFGLTTVRTDDMNIGQVLERIAPHMDYIAPMVYPSHYPEGYDGFKNPAAHPYEIILQAMSRASERLLAASSSPAKLRPWVQDFDLGATYTAEMIRQEKQAVYDAGLDSWMSWDPKNIYKRGAYKDAE